MWRGAEMSAETSSEMEVFLFTGGPNAIGAPAQREDVPKAWRRLPRSVRLWRDGAWRSPEGVAELARGVGPDLGYTVEMSRDGPRPLCIIRTEAEGLSATHAARKTAHAVRAALGTVAGRVTGALFDGEDADAFAVDLRVALNLPHLPVYTVGEVGETVIPLAEQPMSGLQPPRARIRIGRLLARAVAKRIEPASPLQGWIWSSRQYQCWMEDVSAQTEAAMVALPHVPQGHGFFRYGFGQRYFAKRGIPTIYIRCAKSRWFQNAEALEVAAAIRKRVGATMRLTTYGTSMGGYGALIFSGPLQAETALAIAPQFSVDPEDVPGETRWRGSARRIGGFIHDMKALVHPETRKIVIYDRMSPDRLQFDRLPIDPSWDVLNLPFASHQTLAFLAETRTLDLLLSACPGTGPDLGKLRDVARSRRRDSQVYWREMRTKAEPRRPAWGTAFKARWWALEED